MANGADGSITIDTELDNTGFKRDSQQMERATQSLVNTVNRAGKDMASAVQSVNPALRDLARNCQQSGQQIANNLSAGGFGKAMNDMQKQANALSAQFARMGDQERLGIKTAAQMARFQLSTEKARDTLALLIGELNRFTNQPINTAEWERLQADIKQADAELYKLNEKWDMLKQLGAKDNSMGMQRLKLQIEQAGEKYDELYNKIAESIDRGSYAQLGGDTTQYQDMADKIREMAVQLAHYEQIAANFNAIQNPAQQSESALESVDAELRQKPKDASIASQALSGLGSVMGKLGRFALSASIAVGRMSLKGLRNGAVAAANGVKGLVGALKHLHRTGKQSALTSNGLVKALFSIKRMLLSRIKRTFISALFNSLKQGMNAFARYSSAFNAAMSSMKNSMTGLSGNLAVMAGNLVNAIAPALSTIIDWVSKAITYLNALFALLSGKSTYTVAKKGTDSYADSLKSAGGAAKELKNEVYSFDELNKAQDNSSSGGGGGNGGVDFEEKSLADLPDSIKNFMQAIKNAFAAGEWEQIGAIVAGGLNSVVSTVDNWIQNKLEPEGVKWASRIARVLNGFNSEFDFRNLGSTISHGLNAILNILNTFLTTFDALQFGKKLGEGISGFIHDLDWGLLGETLANGFNLAIDTLSGAVSNIPWGELGQKFVTGLQSFIDTIHWDQLEDFVVNGINGVIEALEKVVTNETLWKTIQDKFSTSVHNIVEGISWSKMIIVILSGLLRITSTMLSAIAKLPWGTLGSKFADGLNKIFGNGNNEYVNWTQITGFISESINGIVEAIKNFNDKLDWNGIAEQFATNVNDIISGVKWADMIDTITKLIVDFGGSMLLAIAQIHWDELGAAFAEGLNKVFGKDKSGQSWIDWNDLAKKFSDAVKSILTGIDKFLTEADWGEIGATIGEALGNIDWFGIAGKLISLLWHALVAAASAAGGLIGAFIAKLFGIDVVETFSGEGVNWAESLLEGFHTGLITGTTDTAQQTVQAAALLASGFTESVTTGLANNAGTVQDAARWFIFDLASACEGDSAELVMQAFENFGASISPELAGAIASSEAVTLTSASAKDLLFACCQATSANEVIATFAEYGIEIPQGLAEKLALGKEPISEAARALLYALEQASTLEEVKLAFANAGIEVSDSFASSITGIGLDNMTAALALFGSGVDEATVAALDTTNLAGNLEQYMHESGASINQVALALMVASGKDIDELSKQLGIDVGETLGGIIPESVAKALRLGKIEVKNATNEVKEAGEISDTQRAEMESSGTEAGEGTTGNLAAAENAGASEVGSEADNVANEVKDPLSKLPDEVKPYADQLMAAVTQAIISGDPVAVAAMNAAAQAIVNEASNILTETAGDQIMGNFLGGMNTKIKSMETGTLIPATRNAANTIVNTFKNILTIAQGITIGKNIASGIASGITASTGAIVSAANRAAQAALAAAKASLGIHSPSKAFAEVGDYMMQGMALGLKDGQSDVLKTVSGIAQNLLDSTQNETHIGVSADNMLDGLSGIADRLDQIGSIFAGIVSAISSMGGLPVPSVASGAFSPYKLRGGDTSGAGSAESLVTSFNQRLAGLEEMLSQIMDNQRETTRAINNKDLSIDKRSLEESVTSQQRSRIRAYGGA